MLMTKTPESRPRGRPRPAETIERDEKVLALLRRNPDGLTRNAIAEALDVNTSVTWLALDRLRRAGAVEKVDAGASKDTLWIIGADES